MWTSRDTRLISCSTLSVMKVSAVCPSVVDLYETNNILHLVVVVVVVVVMVVVVLVVVVVVVLSLGIFLVPSNLGVSHPFSRPAAWKRVGLRIEEFNN